MTMSHPVITDVGSRGDLAHESSVVNVLARAGQATPPGRSMKRTLQLRYAAHRFWKGGGCGCRASADLAKAAPTAKTSSQAVVGTTGVRAAAWGGRTGGVNWGPSATGGMDPQSLGINHKPGGGRERRGCGRSKQRSGRTIEPDGEPRATGPAVVVRSLRCRLDASPTTGKTPGTEIPTVTAYKQALKRPAKVAVASSGFEAVLGKTHRTEF
jgi:hypothetical protein